MAGNILEAELRLKGSDQTGAAFAGVIAHAKELQKTLAGVGRQGLGGAKLSEANAQIRQQTRLLNTDLAAVRAINRAFSEGNAALRARSGLIAGLQRRWQGVAAAGGVGWMVGGIASGRATRSIAQDATAFEHQRAILATGGMKPDEVKRAVDVAQAMRVPLKSATDNLKAIGELRMVFGSTEHAIDHAVPVQRAAAMMQAVNPQMDAENEAYNLARALEVKGVSNDPAHFTKLTNSMVQAVNASHGKVTGSGFFEFTKYSRGAAQRLSDDFYTHVAPTLIQELGGHSAGMAMSSFRQQLVGGKMTNRAAEEFVRLGLIDPQKVIRTKTGAVKGVRPGGLVGAGLASEDPYAWIQGYLKPALAKAKITDPNKISEELAHLFSNRYAEQMANILLNQRQRIEKDWKLIAEAPSTEALEKLRGHDPRTALTDLSAGINSLLAALGSPLAARAPKIINLVADAARYLASGYADIDKKHPWAAAAGSAAGAGGLLYVGLKGLQATFGLLTGSTALKGSAAALTSSAAALEAAAARLGGGALPGIGPGKPGSKGRGALGAVWEFMKPLALYETYKYGSDLVGSAFDNLPHPAYPQGYDPNEKLNESIWQQVGGIGKDLFGEPAKLEGKADVNVSVKVNAGDGLVAEIERVVATAIGHLKMGTTPTGTSGSTGSAMPEAFPMGAE